MKKRSDIIPYSVVCWMVLIVSCHQSNNNSVVVARAGDAVLTLDEATENIDTTRGNREIQIAQYARAWLNSELLYQEARRNGIESSPEFLKTLDHTKHQLAGQEYLQHFLRNDTSAITDPMLQEYYNSHASEFVVRNDMMRLNIIVFGNRDRATSFSSSIARGATWEQTVKTVTSDTAIGKAGARVVPSQYYSQKTLYPFELWKVASAQNIMDVSFPVKISDGYAVVQLLARVREGSTGPFDMVRDEVRQRVTIMREQLKYAELLGTLRKRYTVELHVGSQPQEDTTRLQTHE